MLNRIRLAAALKKIGQTTYQMAPQLYPLGRRSREAAEAATRLLLKRKAKAIEDVMQSIDKTTARSIAAGN